jgi:AraC family transcriptional regulator
MKALEIGQSSGVLKKSVHTGSLIINLVQYEGAHCPLGQHYHVQPHFSYIFKGEDIERKNNTEQKRLTGQLFFYEAGEPHQTLYRKETTQNIVIELSSLFLQQYNLNTRQLGASSTHGQLNILMANLLQAIRSNADTNEIEFLVAELVCNNQDRIRNQPPAWTKTVRNYLYDNWNSTINLDELAKLTGLHPVTLSKNFRLYFHCNLAEYRRRIKIERSLTLLKNSKASLTDIAYECGFSDQSHFIRVFKEVTNFLPYQYRNLNLQAD